MLRLNLNKAEGRRRPLRILPLPYNTLLPLELLSSGEWAEVAEVTGEPAWVSRMAELGLRAGSRLRVLQPGRPCLLQVGGSRLSLRGDWDLQILVRPVALAG
jgi:Fe2+ transport system protein FeoA